MLFTCCKPELPNAKVLHGSTDLCCSHVVNELPYVKVLPFKPPFMSDILLSLTVVN